jgi:hypothetical protein
MNKLWTSSIAITLLSLAGCASNPSVNTGINAKEYANNVFGTEYNFRYVRADNPLLSESLSGEHDKKYGYVGLGVVFSPFEAHCQKLGGSFDVKAKDYINNASFPSKAYCSNTSQVFWGLEVSYTNTSTVSGWLMVTVNPVYIEGEKVTKKLVKIEKHHEYNKTNFANSSQNEKNIGDKVCSKKNEFGFIDNIANNKIKVQILGVVKNQTPYFFFDTSRFKMRFTYQKPNMDIIWAESRSWGTCGFNPD